MAYIHTNTNPVKNLVGDCVIRGIALLTDRSWESIYWDIVLQGAIMHDMPSSNEVWMSYLKSLGYRRMVIPNNCPDCYTVKDFCDDNPFGKFLLATGTHVIAIIDGNYHDTWDSGNEIPIYYFVKEE